VARLRDALPDFPLWVRISCTEYVADGYPMEEMVALAQMLEAAGVTALDLSGGTNESPALSRFCIQPPSMPRGCLAPYAKPITDAVKIPTILAGRIVTPGDAEAALADGSADYISLGRALFADAYWPQKAFGVMPTPIRACISCNVCFERLTLERDVACVQNPMVGTELEAPELAEPQLGAHRATTPRRILVLGAGVAGLEVARVAAAQGHQVEIWDSAARPGGQMHLAIAAPDKHEVQPVWDYRWQQVQQFGVPLRMAQHASETAIRAFAPDHIMVATGARPRALTLPDGTGIPLQAWDVIANPAQITQGARVVIIGGGIVGLELAEVLALRGCRITVLEAGAALAPSMARNNRTDTVLRLKDAGVVFHTKALAQRLADGALDVLLDGKAERITGIDHVVAAIGAVPNRDALPAVEATGIPYTLLGDANQPGDFMTVLRDAWMAGLAIGISAETGRKAQ